MALHIPRSCSDSCRVHIRPRPDTPHRWQLYCCDHFKHIKWCTDQQAQELYQDLYGQDLLSLNIHTNQQERTMKKRYRDESRAHERRESRSQEQREERMERRGYRETESGRMVKSSPRRSLMRGK